MPYSQACFLHDLHTQISGGDYSCEHYLFCGDYPYEHYFFVEITLVNTIFEEITPVNTIFEEITPVSTTSILHASL